MPFVHFHSKEGPQVKDFRDHVYFSDSSPPCPRPTNCFSQPWPARDQDFAR